MTKDIERTINNVINIPRDLRGRGNCSLCSLLYGSNYFFNHYVVTEIAIRDSLCKNPEIVNDWLDYSGDKRVNSGWFFRRSDTRDGYQIGYYPCGSVIDYPDGITACAAFIKHEIEDIRMADEGN